MEQIGFFLALSSQSFVAAEPCGVAIPAEAGLSFDMSVPLLNGSEEAWAQVALVVILSVCRAGASFAGEAGTVSTESLTVEKMIGHQLMIR